MGIPFAKLQGAGNGYVVIDGRELKRDWSELARAICDPNFGAGSDGLALVQSSDLAPVRMRIFNSDGFTSADSSDARQLGNHGVDIESCRPDEIAKETQRLEGAIAEVVKGGGGGIAE